MPPPEFQSTATALQHHVLILGADLDWVGRLQEQLGQAGFGASGLWRAEDFPAALDREAADLVILDWNPAGDRALQMLRGLRRLGDGLSPRVMVVSACAIEARVLAAFEAGADDFVAIPYSVAELLARVRALLRSRKREGELGEVLRFRELQVSPHDYRLVVRGEPVALRGSEYRLLEFLVRHPEHALSRAQLLEHARGRNTPADERAIDVTVQRLRLALARHGCAGYIQTVRGVGYRLSAAAGPRGRSPASA